MHDTSRLLALPAELLAGILDENELSVRDLATLACVGGRLRALAVSRDQGAAALALPAAARSPERG